MNFELIPDLISKNVLLEEINSTRKTLESTSKRNSKSTLEQKTVAKHTPKYPKKIFCNFIFLDRIFLACFFSGRHDCKL
jgi:hypothetical protein